MRYSDFPATHEDENVTDNFILIDSSEAVAVDDNSIDTVVYTNVIHQHSATQYFRRGNMFLS